MISQSESAAGRAWGWTACGAVGRGDVVFRGLSFVALDVPERLWN